MVSGGKAPFELWYADACRFDLLPVVRSMWMRRGEPIELSTPGKNARVGVVGAVRYPDRRFCFSHQRDRVTAALVPPVVEELVRHAKRANKVLLLVIDQGRPFSARLAQQALEEAAPWLTVIKIPKYTSQWLNWIEPFWDHLKDTYFGRMLTRSARSFPSSVGRLLGRMRRGPLGRLPKRNP